jgi:hypothetical protein
VTQLCIVHQIRNSTRFVVYKERRAFCADLRTIYDAPNQAAAADALDRFRRMELFETTLLRGKTQAVSIEQVKSAYDKVKSNGDSGGVDGVSLPEYEANKVNLLYTLWNRMAPRGRYQPVIV